MSSAVRRGPVRQRSGPQVLQGVSPIRPPPLRQLARLPHAGGQAEPLEGAPHSEVARHEGIRVAERPHLHVRHRPRADPGQGQQPGGRRLPIDAAIQHDLARRQRLRQADDGAAAGQRHAETVGTDTGQHVGARERPPHGADGGLQTASVALDEALRQRPRPRHAHLLAEDGTHSQLRPVHVARDPQTGTPRHGAAEHGVAAQDLGHGGGVGVEVEQLLDPLHGEREVAQVVELHRAADGSVPAVARGDDAVAAGEAERPPIERAVTLLEPRNGPVRQEAEEAPDREGRPVGKAERHRPRATATTPGDRRAPACPLSHGARRLAEDLPHCFVELAHAAETGCEDDLAEAQISRLEQQARRVGPLGASQLERAGTHLGDEQPLQLPRAVAETAGEAGHPLPVDDAVADGAHGATHDVAAAVPLGRAGRRSVERSHRRSITEGCVSHLAEIGQAVGPGAGPVRHVAVGGAG